MHQCCEHIFIFKDVQLGVRLSSEMLLTLEIIVVLAALSAFVVLRMKHVGSTEVFERILITLPTTNDHTVLGKAAKVPLSKARPLAR